MVPLASLCSCLTCRVPARWLPLPFRPLTPGHLEALGIKAGLFGLGEPCGCGHSQTAGLCACQGGAVHPRLDHPCVSSALISASLVTTAAPVCRTRHASSRQPQRGGSRHCAGPQPHAPAVLHLPDGGSCWGGCPDAGELCGWRRGWVCSAPLWPQPGDTTSGALASMLSLPQRLN